MAGKPREIHGNKTKIDPDRKIEPLYSTNPVTVSERKIHETPVSDDDNVSYARKFQEENEK